MGKNALLLSGGAARGPIAMASLEELNHLYGKDYFDVIEGVSMGSLEGPFYALGILPALRTMFLDVDGVDWFMRLDIEHLQHGVYTLRPLRKKYEKLLEPYWEKLKALDVDVRVGVYDLASDRYRSISARSCKSFDEWCNATMASCAMHPLMDKWDVIVREKGKLDEVHPAVDGGFVHVLPPLPEWKEMDHIVAILHSEAKRVHPEPPDEMKGLLKSTGRVLEQLVDNVVRGDIKRLKDYAKAGKDVTLIAPPVWPGDSLDASHETMVWRLEQVGPLTWENRKEL